MSVITDPDEARPYEIVFLDGDGEYFNKNCVWQSDTIGFVQ
jgi:hypothetical protein